MNILDEMLHAERINNLQTARTNRLLEAILAKVTQILNVLSENPNSPPQYTGPTDLQAFVGHPRQLQGTDVDGDKITWTLDDANKDVADLTSEGLLTMKVASGDGGAIPVTVYLDDGKPEVTHHSAPAKA